MQRLQDLRLTHCCTLLSEREGAPAIKKICARLGVEDQPCNWVWLPMEGGNLEVLRQTDIQELVSRLKSAMGDVVDAHVYLHCSAGIHRTGFFAYILLRLMGHDPTAALAALTALRQVTADQVGDERITLAEEVVASLISGPG